jgi:hypothetical protein
LLRKRRGLVPDVVRRESRRGKAEAALADEEALLG